MGDLEKESPKTDSGGSSDQDVKSGSTESPISGPSSYSVASRGSENTSPKAPGTTAASVSSVSPAVLHEGKSHNPKDEAGTAASAAVTVPRCISKMAHPKKKFLSTFTSGDRDKVTEPSTSRAGMVVKKSASGVASMTNTNPQTSVAAPAETKSAPGQCFSITSCIARIMESELVRNTLQEDSEPKSRRRNLSTELSTSGTSAAPTGAVPTTVPKPSPREESDEDSNMPLMPHDIQKQIKSVYSVDIEQDKGQAEVVMSVSTAAHMEALMLSKAMLAGRHPMAASLGSAEPQRGGGMPDVCPSPRHPLHEAPVRVQEGGYQSGALPHHFRPYPARLPGIISGAEHRVSVPYSAIGKFQATAQDHPESTPRSKTESPAPAMGVIRPMVQPFRSQGSEEMLHHSGQEGLPGYPIFPPMGVRLPNGSLGVSMVPPGGIGAGRPPVPIPNLILADPQRVTSLPPSLSATHVQAVASMTSSVPPVAQVAPHGVVHMPSQQTPRHLLQMGPTPRLSAPIPRPAAPAPAPATGRVVPPPVISPVPDGSMTRSHGQQHSDLATASSQRGQASTYSRDDYSHIVEPYHPPGVTQEDPRDKKVPKLDPSDQPLDLSVKKPELSTNQDSVQHCSTHLLGLQQTMQRHMDGVTTQSYDHQQVLVQSAILPGTATRQGLPLRPSTTTLPPGVQHSSTPTPLPVHHRPLSPRPTDAPHAPPVVPATRIERRGSSYDSNHDSSASGMEGRSPSPASRVSIASILGDHPPNDILFLKCSQCTSTYGSLHSFKKHFSKAHGREPTKDDVTIQSISATRTALEKKENSAERQEALASLNLLPSNKYYESQIARYKNFEGEEGEQYMLKIDDLEQKMSKSPSTPDDDQDTEGGNTFKVKPESGEQNMMKCLQCGEEFPTRDWGVFRRHVRAHENPCEGQFRCSVCRQGFQEEYQWRRHMSTSHMMQSCHCRKCNIAFTHVGDLNKHLQTSHRGVQSVEVEFKCLYCSRTFLSPSDLLLHTQDHERKFECQNRNKNQKGGPLSRQQDKAVSVPAVDVPIVRSATPDTTCSEDKKSPEARAEREKVTLPEAQDPRPRPHQQASAAGAAEEAGNQSEHHTGATRSGSTSGPHVQRSSSAPELQSQGKSREYVNVYDIIQMKLEAEHKAEHMAEKSSHGWEPKNSHEQQTERSSPQRGYSGLQCTATNQGEGDHLKPKDGMHKLPAIVHQPSPHRSTPEPRHSRSPAAPKGTQEVKHSPLLQSVLNPTSQPSQLPILQSALDSRQLSSGIQHRRLDTRNSHPQSPPLSHPVAPPPCTSSQRLVVTLQGQLSKHTTPQPSHLQQHLLGKGPPFGAEGREMLACRQQQSHPPDVTPGLDTLAHAAANSKPVDINKGHEKSPSSLDPRRMSHDDARVILTGEKGREKDWQGSSAGHTGDPARSHHKNARDGSG